jgi:hypothetical protein
VAVGEPARAGEGTVVLTATLPASAATPAGLVTFLARVVDRHGRATALVSQHFELAAAPRPGAVLRFSRQLPAPPAKGRLELVVYDHATGRATVSRVPAP